MTATVELETANASLPSSVEVGAKSKPFPAADRAPLTGHEMLENGVATLVDMASIMVAYAIGMHESSILVGIGYGFLDAFLVVWMRKPFARLVRWAASLSRRAVAGPGQAGPTRA